MTTKNMLGGALINYGENLPAVGTTPDGSVFFKTAGGGEGLYIYRLIPDTSAAFGSQSAAGWTQIVAFGSGINADTLDGFDSSYFQPGDPDLTGLAALGSTGVMIRTAAGSFTTRSILAGSGRVSTSNGDGVSGNILLDVVEGNLQINNIGGTLALSKGGTNSTAIPPAGSVIVSNGSAMVATAVGAATAGSGLAQNWQVLSSTGSGTPTWINTTALNVAHANNAATASSATNSTQLGGIAATEFYRYEGFTLDANTMPVQRSGFTYSLNAPFTGPIESVGPATYQLQFNAPYGFGGPSLAFRTRDGDLNTWNPWRRVLTSADFTNWAPSLTGAGASGTWSINVTGNAATATNASNTSSVSNATGGSYTWTGQQSFVSSANTGVGSASGTLMPQSTNSSTAATISFHRVGAYGLNMGLDNDNVFRIGGWSAAPNRLTLDMNGNLGVAGSMFTSGMEIRGDSPTITFRDINQRTGFIHVNSNTLYILRGGVDATSWDSGPGGTFPMTMNLDTGGVVFSGTVTATGGFATSAAASFGATTVTGTLTVNGAITATGNITAFAPSDARLKKDVEVIGAAVDTVKKLRGVTYTLKESGKREVGLIAQELKEVVPEVVRMGSDGFYGVQYGHMVGLLVEAIKEQQQQIEDLKRRLDAIQE